MKPLDCCLTLVCHKSLEERLVDHLLEHPEWVNGFSVSHLEGHSQKENLPSILEQVRGRSQRIEIRTVLNRDDAQALIAHLKTEEPNHEIAYWLMPVIEFGRLA
ncbi:MAG: DUF3240 domain-containing protein [Sideroxydans sp.]|nr:DUF3240 domain-containing protein [Sideroxydans sp.]